MRCLFYRSPAFTLLPLGRGQRASDWYSAVKVKELNCRRMPSYEMCDFVACVVLIQALRSVNKFVHIVGIKCTTRGSTLNGRYMVGLATNGANRSDSTHCSISLAPPHSAGLRSPYSSAAAVSRVLSGEIDKDVGWSVEMMTLVVILTLLALLRSAASPEKTKTHKGNQLPPPCRGS